MNGYRQPDQSARLISHALVGLGVGYLGAKEKGFAGFIVGVVVGTAAHEVLDAPVAQLLADFGV
jgi:hypothetical protein